MAQGLFGAVVALIKQCEQHQQNLTHHDQGMRQNQRGHETLRKQQQQPPIYLFLILSYNNRSEEKNQKRTPLYDYAFYKTIEEKEEQ